MPVTLLEGVIYHAGNVNRLPFKLNAPTAKDRRTLIKNFDDFKRYIFLLAAAGTVFAAEMAMVMEGLDK